MTRKNIIDIICHDHAIPTALGPMLVGDIADRILAALEREREGEKVLAEGELFSCIHKVYGRYHREVGPKDQRGSLIFRPTKAKEAGL